MALKVLILSLVVLFFPAAAHGQQLPLKQNQQIIQQQGKTVVQKSHKLTTEVKEVESLQTKKQTLAQQIESEKKTADELRQKIAQKKAEKKAAEEKAAQAAQAAKAVQTSSPVIVQVGGPRSGCGDNQYAAFIYGNESGGRVPGNCNTTITNAEGCVGIGQACPASKLLAVCPNLDYDCQNAFFTRYAISRYGSWQGAYEFWIAHRWW